MDALVPAFVAALLAGVGDRPARLAALLAGRGAWASVVSGMLIGHAAAIALSVAGAMLIAPYLAPNPKSLLLALALLLAGAAACWPRRPVVAERGALLPAATGAFVTGDGTAFLAFALGVKGSAPVLAGIGALAGAAVLAVAAAGAGRDWERLPLASLGRIAGALLIVTGTVVGLGALRLI